MSKNGNMDSVKRKYDSLTGWVGRNPVEKMGTVICVSTKNDEDYDVSFVADGVSTFLQLYNKATKGGGDTPVATKEDVEEAVADYFEKNEYVPTKEEQKQAEKEIETDWEAIFKEAEKSAKG